MDFFDFIKNNKFVILIISIIMNILLLLVTFYFAINYFNHECICDANNLAINNEVTDVNESFYVEIKGAVKTPGVYEVSNNNIINDIVKLAGGFTKKAYTNNINLSKKVSNEMVIYVYTKSEYEKKAQEEKVEQTTCECPTYEIDNCTEELISEIVVNKEESEKNTSTEENTNISSDNSSNVVKDEIVDNNSAALENETKLININKATKEELMNLSGIGESKADAIIEYRTNTSLFKTIEDIKNVSGIGDSLFEKIKDSITV